MATAPQPSMPLFYNRIEPLSSSAHSSWKARGLETAPFLVNAHAVPITVEEFVVAQRHYPIVFSSGADPVPLALMGLNEGVNVFVDGEGRLNSDVYVPAYVRRYPFMLARLRDDSEDLSLCFDPTSGALGDFEEGNPLFEDGQPSQMIQDVLGFCERFEQSAIQTGQFMRELKEHGLLIDGEVSIQPDNAGQPFVYRGFQMVSEEALRNLRGDVLRKMVQSGMLPLVFAHLFSLSLVRDVFGKQMVMGKVPPQPVANS